MMRVLHKDKKTKTQDESIVKTQCSKLEEMKLTLEKTISPIKALRFCLQTLTQKNAPPTLSHGEGRWGKSLRTKINESIAIRKLKKKPHPTFLFERMGGVMNYNT
jgi:hypothetical protein